MATSSKNKWDDLLSEEVKNAFTPEKLEAIKSINLVLFKLNTDKKYAIEVLKDAGLDLNEAGAIYEIVHQSKLIICF